MDDGTLFERAYGGLRAFVHMQGEVCDAASRIEREGGLLAGMNPRIPHRSIWNDVMYDDPAAVEAALPEIADMYDEAGVTAWTVWVRPGHDELARLLESEGHVLDADPMAMACPVDDVPRPEQTSFWTREGDIQTMARLNEQAYNYEPGDFSNGFDRHPPGMSIYVAGTNGEAQSCAGSDDQDDNCDITLVATALEARGRGMAGALIRRLVEDARGRGCTTTSLVATKAGYPVYRRLGYQDLGRIQMWERRKPDG